MKKSAFLILALTFITTQSFKHGYAKRKKHVIVWQPSHQTDTGKDFSEAAVCGAIVDAAMETKPRLKEYRINRLSRECLMINWITVNHSYHKVVKYSFTKSPSVKAIKEFIQVCLHMFFTALMMDAS